MCLLRATADVRRENEVVKTPKVFCPLIEVGVEIIAIGSRLVRVHIQSSSGDLSGTRCLDERRDVDDAAAAGIDEVDVAAQQREAAAVDQQPAVVVERRMDGDDVRGAALPVALRMSSPWRS